MPTDNTVPGVYIEEDASPAMSVSAGATAVPLFVARFIHLKKEQPDVITRIGSWLDYTTLFNSNMPSSVTVNVARKEGNPPAAKKVVKKASSGTSEVTNEDTYRIDNIDVVDHSASVSLKLYFQNGGGPCYLYSLESKGDVDKLDALPGHIDEVGEITLLACPDPDEEYRKAVYGALSTLLDQHKGYFLLADSGAEGNVPYEFGDSAQVAVYYPNVVTPYTRTLDDEHITIVGYNSTDDETSVTLANIRKNNPVFADEIDKALADKRSTTLSLTPSALIAGVYAKTDGERGVWKAPANVVLNGVSDVSVRVTNERQAELNPYGINVIRYFSERGLVVWGSRTQKNDDNWRYIPVRRLFDAAERDIKKALLPMVFEPNSQPTWKRVQAAIDNYLYRIWQQGALAGNKAEEAYFVRVGKGITMTQDEINQGKMIVQVGMAAVRPAEFIILKFTQDMSQ